MRTLVLIDGQNLYHLARESMGLRVVVILCLAELRRREAGARPGLQDAGAQSCGNSFLHRRPRSGSRAFTAVLARLLVEQDKVPAEPRGLRLSGQGECRRAGKEGVDVSLALDLVRATYERWYEVAIVVSQDWDFGPAVRLAKEIARTQDRRLVFESAFPLGPGSHSRRGVPGTIWVPIDQATYDTCLDPRDYRPNKR